MTRYILLSVDDRPKSLADAQGIEFLDKYDTSAILGIARDYRDKRAMLVDDNEIAGESMLRSMKVETNIPDPDFAYFKNPRDALEAFSESLYDLVFTDYDITRTYNTTGLEIIAKMKRIEKQRSGRSG